MPQGEPISHAEMIAAMKRQITYWSAHSLELGLRLSDEQIAHDLRPLWAVLAHLERTQWRPRSEIVDSTLGLDTEILGFQPDIGNEAEDEMPSRYGVTTAGHLASGGWERCTNYLLLSPPAPQEAPHIPPIITCPKCGATAMAFVCSERGCPVNGGAAYE